MKLILSTTVIFIAVLFLNFSAKAATFTVTNTNDDGTGSLRYLVSQANATEEEDTIVFDAQVFTTPKTITLTGGQISSVNSLTITGPGANLLTISGNNQSRIFFSNYSGSVLTLNNLTLTGGFAANGGAIYATSTLRLSKVMITGNTAKGAELDSYAGYASLGGGIYSASGELTITDSIISDNSSNGTGYGTPNAFSGLGGADARGGGIYSYGFSATIINCTFSNNAAKGGTAPAAINTQTGGPGGSALGGALFSAFGLKIYNSTFTNNLAVGGDGGAIPSYPYTLGGNGGAASAGAIQTAGSSVILNSLINSNKSIGGNGGISGANVNNAGNGGNALGGGILIYDLKMANTTIIDNTVAGGGGRIGGNASAGGIRSGSDQSSVVNSTITGNSAAGGTGVQSNGTGEAGGVGNASNNGQSSNFSNNIVAENSAPAAPDVQGNFVNSFNNLIGKGEGATGLTNGVNGNLAGTNSSPVNPLLAALGNNGGITKTRALLSGSPAINAGNNSRTLNPIDSQILQFDQRGFERITPSGGTVDIGAFELGATNVPTVGAPDLRNASDTGISDSDNLTKAAVPVFDILNVIPGARVELLRDNVVVSSATATATAFSIALTDPNPPVDRTVQYAARQTLGESTSQIGSALSVTFDSTSPTVTINQAAAQADPATALPIRFTVVFSERVGDFDQSDISLAGSTADVSAASKYISTTDYLTYTVEISGIRSPGQITANIPARAVYDFVINYSAASTSTDNSITFQPNTINAAVGGRIKRNSGLIRTSATVTFTDIYTGEIWTARTNPFGYYNFPSLKIYGQIGSRFSVRITNKSFSYAVPQPVTITANRSNLNYTVP